MDKAILKFFESIRCDFLDGFFSFFSLFGDVLFIGALLIVFYFIVNKNVGEELIFSLCTSLVSNCFLKGIISRPRPFVKGVVKKVEIHNILCDTTDLNETFSMPSGHAQQSSTIFATLSFHAKTALKITFAIAVFLVICARIYLGVHYPTDVIVGVILGVLASIFWQFICKKYNDKKYLIFLIFGIISALLLIFLRGEKMCQAVGLTLGLSAGMFLENKFVNLPNAKSLKNKLLRLLFSLLITVIIGILPFIFLKKYIVALTIIYAVLTLVLTFICPLIFKKFNLFIGE